ncbi:hypothetical protein ONZ45_g16993 [Pleurotus djamor]|nr:hypothetical protein ONZ45_g16993 [Pleurotus djamor]
MSTYDTIEPDVDDNPKVQGNIASPQAQNARTPVVLTPTNHASQMATTHSDAESGIAGIFRQSAHPLALFFLFIFRITAIVVYIMCGWVTDNYVLSTVVVVVLLAMDFWNCRNVSGRTLVDEDGESYWVFESRDPSRPANPIDSKYIPIVVLALVFNFTNAIGFTYADRDAKQRWATGVAGGWALGGIGGQLVSSAISKGVGKMFG